MNKLKTLVITLPIILILPGCFGDDSSGGTSTTTTNGGKQLYETTSFSIEAPFDWDIIEENNLRPNIPEETIVAFRNNIKNDIFTANVNISTEDVLEGVTSASYARDSKLAAQKNLISFQEIETVNQVVDFGEETINGVIIEFSGKKSPTDPIVVFKSLYVVKNSLGYTITAAYLPGEDETIVKYTNEMLESFSLK